MFRANQNAPTPDMKGESLHRQPRFPSAALAALALIAAFEICFVWNYRYHFWDANYILLEKKREALLYQPKADDVAIFGSSRFYHLRTDAIARLIGKDAQVSNYSWGYCGVETYEAMLRGLISANRIPGIILVDGSPEIFGYPYKLLTISESEAFRVGYTQTVPLAAGIRTEVGHKEWDTTADIFNYAITPPSTLYREQIISKAYTMFQTGERPNLPPDYERFVRTWMREGWFQYAPPERVANMEDFRSLEVATGPYLLRENKSITASYERFIRLAKEHDIQVIMLPVPNNELVYQTFAEKGIYDKYDKWLSRLEKKHHNFTAPAPRWIVWPGLLGDSLHVNAAGAARHMEVILDLLRSRLGIEQHTDKSI